jgi:hypothetical protein
MASLADMNRGELEALAADLGIEDPEGYPNMGSLRDAISQKQQEEAPVAEDDATTQDDAPQQEAAASGDGGASQVQEMMDKEQEQGYVGRKVDRLPNDAYSMEGGAPEPGDNPTTPSEEDVKADPRLGDQYEGQATHTPYEE